MHTIATITQPEILDMPGAGPALGVMAILFAVFAVLFVCVVGFITYSAMRRASVAREAGLDPFAGDVQLMAAAKNSQMLAPERSVGDRLAEVDQLREAGTITADEHAAARARIIGTV